ncbi:hypothetical protein, partial [Kaarinaea lacus]
MKQLFMKQLFMKQWLNLVFPGNLPGCETAYFPRFLLASRDVMPVHCLINADVWLCVLYGYMMNDDKKRGANESGQV